MRRKTIEYALLRVKRNGEYARWMTDSTFVPMVPGRDAAKRVYVFHGTGGRRPLIDIQFEHRSSIAPEDWRTGFRISRSQLQVSDGSGGWVDFV